MCAAIELAAARVPDLATKPTHEPNTRCSRFDARDLPVLHYVHANMETSDSQAEGMGCEPEGQIVPAARSSCTPHPPHSLMSLRADRIVSVRLRNHVEYHRTNPLSARARVH